MDNQGPLSSFQLVEMSSELPEVLLEESWRMTATKRAARALDEARGRGP